MVTQPFQTGSLETTTTVPLSAAKTGEPFGTAMSTPVCFLSMPSQPYATQLSPKGVETLAPLRVGQYRSGIAAAWPATGSTRHVLMRVNNAPLKRSPIGQGCRWPPAFLCLFICFFTVTSGRLLCRCHQALAPWSDLYQRKHTASSVSSDMSVHFKPPLRDSGRPNRQFCL